ncbi:hypothetical protein F511_23184 [Dorcoceras hygrometricum]|uniref:Uncharacterized protein n=1 Tax=Dorcoceras hygrometricum TaxID=472368 RepID=A0A2Z7BM36_9LAMI|nr:hypothetical protein F511_23184 [Dorcoceras hygrometricum]
MEAPIKILSRYLDSYVRNMSTSGAHVFYGSSLSCPTPQVGSLPRNAGMRSFESGYLRRSIHMSRQGEAAPAPRSQSGRIGRMDERKLREFGVSHVPKVVRPKSLRATPTRRRKIASVDDGDFMSAAKYKRM